MLQTAAVFLLALVMLACHEPAGLHLGHVTYVARTVSGTAVPAPLIQNANYELLLVADTLQLGLFGTAHWVRVRRVTISGAAPQVDVSRTTWSYSLHGDSLRLHLACPPNADCLPPPTGWVADDGRRLFLQLSLPDVLVEYERVSS